MQFKILEFTKRELITNPTKQENGVKLNRDQERWPRSEMRENEQIPQKNN